MDLLSAQYSISNSPKPYPFTPEGEYHYNDGEGKKHSRVAATSSDRLLGTAF
jgi:hypothetical protein